MIAMHDWNLSVVLAAPAILASLVRLVRGRNAPEVLRGLRDALTLRMVLRDSDPTQRAELLNAHRDWRREPSTTPGSTPRQRR